MFPGALCPQGLRSPSLAVVAVEPVSSTSGTLGRSSDSGRVTAGRCSSWGQRAGSWAPEPEPFPPLGPAATSWPSHGPASLGRPRVAGQRPLLGIRRFHKVWSPRRAWGAYDWLAFTLLQGRPGVGW